MSGGEGHGRSEAALLADCIERREENVRADGKVDVFFVAAFDAADDNCSGESRVLQNTLPNKSRNLAWRRRVGEMAFAQSVRLGKLSLFVPAAKPVDFVSADFDVEIMHRNEAWQCGDFVLSTQDDTGCANRVEEAKFFNFGKTLGEFESAAAIDARMRDGFIERDFRRPLRDGVVAFTAFVEADLDGEDFVEKIGGAFDEKVGQSGSGAGVDHGRTIFFLEAFDVAKLLGLKRVSREVRTQVEIMRAKAKRGAKDDFVENGGAGINDELAALGRFDDASEIAGVYFGNGNGALFAQKAPSANRVAVAAPDGVPLALQKLCKERAGGSRSQNEDPHGVGKTVSQDLVGLRSLPRRITIEVSKSGNPKRHCSGYGK